MAHRSLIPSVALAFALFSIGTACGGESERLHQSQREWSTFLDKECKLEMSEEAVRKVMHGKYRDVGYTSVNNYARLVLFLVDDYHQIEFLFSHDDKLAIEPHIGPKGTWVRSPSGEVVSIPSPAERKKKAAARSRAMQYVVDHTDYKPEVLSVYCRRSLKPTAWEIVVTIKSLDVDMPNFLLEISDDGTVRELRPIEKKR